METIRIIRQKLSEDPYISGSVKARLHRGRVSINGKVDAFWKKEIAENIVLGTDGVYVVKSSIRTEPRQKVPDWKIRKQILDSFQENMFIDSSAIRVDVDDGIVSLTGSTSITAKQEAHDIAAFTEGVLDIVDGVEVA
jgi:hyperosmotically inducible periplasmic protein